MDDAIIISNLNDFIFCPASIYFHALYGVQVRDSYQCSDQLNGTAAHETVDTATYSSSCNILQGISCYCEKYNVVGKIDLFDIRKGVLTERKREIKNVYDGYVYQLYAQYFSLKEMGYDVKQIRLYSLITNTVFKQDLPENNPTMLKKFEKLIEDIRCFDIEAFKQTNVEKCRHCIYQPACCCVESIL